MELSLEERERLKQLLLLEEEARQQGHLFVAGVDEAGRGPLAGPVVACACVLKEPVLLAGVNDSKQVSAKKRLELFEQITQHPAICYSVAQATPARIDEINIYRATIEAMHEALLGLSLQPTKALIDGLRFDVQQMETEKVIKGDSRSYSIALASLIAKVTRDAIMEEFDQQYPQYGFAQHKGYGTKAHMAAIEQFGPSPIHRMTFEPLKSLLRERDISLLS